MTDKTTVRESGKEDLAGIEHLYPLAFPDEDLVPLVRSLLKDGPPVLSLVATANARPVGHIIFTICTVDQDKDECALLAPLGVVPTYQGQGIGKTLIRTGLRHLETRGFKRVFVLGDPAYYGRFGFLPERHVAPPYALPKEWADAWQSIDLTENKSAAKGTLSLPHQWLKPALWLP